jgi:tetratricopeptide (TPR) repeat protein
MTEFVIEELLLARRFADSIDCCLTWLEAKRRDPDAYAKLHKGQRFYWLGVAAFASHDYQSATFFFDAAAQEDLKDQNTAQDRPALLFMCLDNKNQNQAALAIVEMIVRKLRQGVDNYNGRSPASGPISDDNVRKHFLRPLVFGTKRHRRTLATTLISFLAEWEYRSQMIELCEAGSTEPFFTHLFRGCLLFESLLKQNPTKTPAHHTLGKMLQYDFAKEFGIDSLPKFSATEKDFGDLVKVVTRTLPIPSATECTAKVRNTLGHDLVWATQPLDQNAYDLLAYNIASSCLHAISVLYVRP